MNSDHRAVLELHRVTKTFGQGRLAVLAVDDATLTVRAGELVIVMGPSGSGKSSLLQLMGALLSPTSGEIRVHGRSLAELGHRQLAALRLRDIGFVFQSFNLLSALSALDNVALPASMAGISRRDRHQRAVTLLERLGLAERAHHLPEALSGGEKQRVAIARALVNDPAIILADEPTGNLDTQSGDEIMELLLSLNRDRGTTVIVVTHDPEVAEQTERIIKIRDGVVEL